MEQFEEMKVIESKPYSCTMRCEDTSFSWMPFLKQMLVISGIWTTYFLTGMVFGSTTVSIPQIRKEAKSIDVLDDEMASWISSVIGIASIPWILLQSLLLHFIGRKWTFTVTCLVTHLGFINFYLSSSVLQFLISVIILGISNANDCVLSLAIATEFSSPCYRGIFLTVKSATFYWGILVANAVGTFYHWKTIGLVSIICSVYYLTVLFWPESPYWLASRGCYEECTKAHRWLKGTGDDMERELSLMIHKQKEYIRISKQTENLSLCERLKCAFNLATSREFYKPLSVCILLTALCYSSGKLVISIYALDIFYRMTRDEFSAYRTMLILDAVTVFTMYMGCILSKYFKRRIMLFTTTLISVLFLYLLSLYLYLIKENVLIENYNMSISLLVLYSLTVSCGPIILCTSICGEIVPVRYASSILAITGTASCSISTLSLKLAPLLFRSFGLHGFFLLYGSVSLLIILLLCRYMPETKDKTLHEIQDFFLCHQKILNQQLPEGLQLIE